MSTRALTPEQTPTTPHWAVLIYTQEIIRIPGAVRSRTHPGHGYPARTETVNSFEHHICLSTFELERFIPTIKPGLKYVILQVEAKLIAQTKVSVKLDKA